MQKQHKNLDPELRKFSTLGKDRPYLIVRRYIGTNICIADWTGTNWTVVQQFEKLSERNKVLKSYRQVKEKDPDDFKFRDYEYLALNIRNLR